MDNSNNDIFENNGVSQQSNNITGTNPIPNTNSLLEINQQATSESSQLNQNVQPQNNSISQINNQTISNSAPTVDLLGTNNGITPQQNILGNQTINNVPQQPSNLTGTNYVPINNQPTMQNNQNPSNFITPQQNISTTANIDDGELLRAFIGNNYEKITTRPFNFAGFFFTSLYMFYRKMFGYAILVFLVNLIVLNVAETFAVTLVFNVLVGFLVNKIYLSYAKKKITIIKAYNSQKNIEELKTICITKGGTSVGKLFLGFLTELVIAFVVLFVMMLVGISSFIGEFLNINNWNITTEENGSINGTLIENVSVDGYSCFNSKCTVSIVDAKGTSTDYILGISGDLFNTLGDYKDYVKLNIYYDQKGNDKTIVSYKIFLKSNNEEITNVKTENELREKIRLYSIGTHTDTFTLTEIGTTGFEYKDDKSYTYIEYTFVDSKNIEYEMKYINNNGTLNVVKGNKYTVTFEVTEDTFGYEFTIKSVK